MKTIGTAVGVLATMMFFIPWSQAQRVTLFQEDFADPAAASGRFEVTKEVQTWVGDPVYAEGQVTLSQYQGGGIKIRTAAANSFLDDANSETVYSVTERMENVAASRITYLYARLGSDHYTAGYYFRHFWDGVNEGFDLVRVNNGAETVLCSLFTPNTPGVNPDNAPVPMSITLRNKTDRVEWQIKYGDTFMQSGADTAADRITRGTGTGVGYQNGGNEFTTSATFDDLQVTAIPQPAGILFRETFDDASSASGRFDTYLGVQTWVPGPSFTDGIVTLQQYQSGIMNIRTNGANNFSDAGYARVTYSVTERMGSAGARFNYFYARLGEDNYSDGYLLRHIWDGWYETFDFIRMNGGVQTVLYSRNTSNGTGLNSAGLPVMMSIVLENKADRVNWTIRYGEALVQSGEDNSAERITSGAGVGVGYMNGGTPGWTECSFDNLEVSVLLSPILLTFTPDSGVLADAQNVVITCDPADATIRYTTDGTDPSADHGDLIVSGGMVSVNHNMTIKALAWSNGVAGTIQSASYTIKTKTPTFSPGGSFISEPKSIAIICDTAGAIIRYTTDGTDPSESNGTQITSGSLVAAGNGTVLKARAWAEGLSASDIKSVTYTIPAVYHRPATIPSGGTVTVDGDLAEWASATWVPLDQPYDGNGGSDVTCAAYAVRWSENKIYVAVKVQDTAHFFTDTYGIWYGRDAVEVYLHTTGLGATNFSFYQDTAQQYTVGIKAGLSGQIWTSLGDKGFVPENAGLAAAAIDGQWIYYELAITPFDAFGGFTGGSNISSPLQAGDVIGLDVCVVSNDGSGTNYTGATPAQPGYTGMKSENTMKGKSQNWMQFGLHKLVNAPKLPGDANNDHKVDVSDLGILAANYGQTVGATWEQGDFNNDGKVDVSDLGILAANYGTGTGGHLDFNADARDLGLLSTNGTKAASDRAADPAELGCASAGLPLVLGLMLMGLRLQKMDE